LREIDKDVDIEDIRKWNIMDAMAWKSIMPAIIQNCFVKWGFGTADSFIVNSHDESRQLEL
jgi:hypothetical protein